MRSLQLAVGAMLAGGPVSGLAAQSADIRMRHFTVEHGLTGNAVNAVAQDSTGFLWVGTRRGLLRFDGYDFTPYSMLDSTADPRLTGQIHELEVDRLGRLWVLTPGQIFWGDPAND